MITLVIDTLNQFGEVEDHHTIKAATYRACACQAGKVMRSWWGACEVEKLTIDKRKVSDDFYVWDVK